MTAGLNSTLPNPSHRASNLWTGARLPCPEPVSDRAGRISSAKQTYKQVFLKQLCIVRASAPSTRGYRRTLPTRGNPVCMLERSSCHLSVVSGTSPDRVEREGQNTSRGPTDAEHSAPSPCLSQPLQDQAKKLVFYLASSWPGFQWVPRKHDIHGRHSPDSPMGAPREMRGIKLARPASPRHASLQSGGFSISSSPPSDGA